VGTLIPLSLSVGQGVLFNNAGSAKSLTFKGQADFVSKTNSFAFTAGFNAFAVQFPAGFDFNSEIVKNVNGADRLQIFDTTTQKFKLYSMYPNTGSSPTWDGKWTEVGIGVQFGALTLNMGQGALYNRNAGSVGTPIKFSRPY
jgi:hypothetical protein